MKRTFTLLLFAFSFFSFANAQDTFSIVAVDSATGQVGSAGASCISADNLAIFFPFDDPDFLGELLPGLGAINTQAQYLAGNQDNAAEQLSLGKTPQEVVDWLAANDVNGNPAVRQYGVAALINGQPMAAGFTGANCINYKNHRVGPNYSIQGNILLGVQILDSMEARFLAAQAAGKCLSEQIMEAMQGAKVPGADTRCLNNGTSSMFAFIKVAQPGDDPTDPMLRLFVSYNPLGIEPIDSLQAKFDLVNPCLPSFVKEAKKDLHFNLSPNPTSGAFELQFAAGTMPDQLRLEVFDATGKIHLQREKVQANEQVFMEKPGVYFVKLTDAAGRTGWEKLVVGR